MAAYLFHLNSGSIGRQKRLQLRGIRQLATIGAPAATQPPEPPPSAQQSPDWKFPEGNFDWHVNK